MQTPEGAVAFVRFYFDQVNKAYTAPDNTLLPPLGESGCKSCAALQSNADEYVSLGHRYASKGVEVRDVAAAEGAPGGQQFVTFMLHQLEASVVDSTGQVVSTKEDQEVERKMLLLWKGDRWSVVDIG